MASGQNDDGKSNNGDVFQSDKIINGTHHDENQYLSLIKTIIDTGNVCKILHAMPVI